MAQGDGPAVDVDPLGIRPRVTEEPQHHRGKSLVHLEQVDVPNGHAGPLQAHLSGRAGGGQHDQGLRCGHCGHDHPRPGG